MSKILKEHKMSVIHQQSFDNWKKLEIRCKSSNTIDKINQKMIRTEIEHWKNVIHTIISLNKVLGNQNLALRGNSDKINIDNNGNFLKFIEFLTQFDLVMKKHIRRITSDKIHLHYLGKEIQN